MARDMFLRMPTDGESPPTLSKGWPSDTEAEGIWKLFIEPDNTSVLFSTKQAWYQNHSHFMELDAATLENTSAHGAFTYRQSQPLNALQAAFNLVLLPHSKIAVRHAATGRYLNFDESTGALSSCESPSCPPSSADFDFWPEIDNDQPKACAQCETPYFSPGKKTPGQFPWYLEPEEAWKRNDNSSKPWFNKPPPKA